MLIVRVQVADVPAVRVGDVVAVDPTLDTVKAFAAVRAVAPDIGADDILAAID